MQSTNIPLASPPLNIGDHELKKKKGSFTLLFLLAIALGTAFRAGQINGGRNAMISLSGSHGSDQIKMNEMSISTPSCNLLPSRFQGACNCFVDACSSTAQKCFSDFRGCGKEVADCAFQCATVSPDFPPFLDDIECMKKCVKGTDAGDLVACAIQNEGKCVSKSDSDQVLVLAPSCNLAPKPFQGACNCLVDACSSAAQQCFSDVLGCGRELVGCVVQCSSSSTIPGGIACVKNCAKSSKAVALATCAANNVGGCI